MIDVNAIRERYAALSQHLDERARRVFAATEAPRDDNTVQLHMPPMD